jgi:hypothetical protein
MQHYVGCIRSLRAWATPTLRVKYRVCGPKLEGVLTSIKVTGPQGPARGGTRVPVHTVWYLEPSGTQAADKISVGSGNVPDAITIQDITGETRRFLHGKERSGLREGTRSSAASFFPQGWNFFPAGLELFSRRD